MDDRRGFETCYFCGVEFDDDTPSFGLPDGVWGLRRDLFEYCEYNVHLHCFETWVDRIEFSRPYFEWRLKNWFGSYQWGFTLIREPSWALVCGRRQPPVPQERLHEAPPEYVAWREAGWAETHIPPHGEVLLRDYVFPLRWIWFNWEAFLEKGYGWLTGQALTEVQPIFTELKNRVPDFAALQALLDKVDPPENGKES